MNWLLVFDSSLGRLYEDDGQSKVEGGLPPFQIQTSTYIILFLAQHISIMENIYWF